jgi:tripartite-type tricarboxylate transporter receptor subunit TctC
VKRARFVLVAILGVASLLMAGCGQGAPAPTPTTKPPAAQAKAEEPTKAPAPTKAAEPIKPAEPTKASSQQPAASKTTDFPQKGKYINLIVPWPAGGSSDVSARLLAAGLEKEMGIPVNVVNKGGASGQVGTTELAKAKPDGYTIAYSVMVPILTTYLDPDRKAAYGREDLQPVAVHSIEPGNLSVKHDSEFGGLKDFIEAAKANPDEIKAGSPGMWTLGHLIILELQRVTGAKFAIVQFEGGGPTAVAVAGGHVHSTSGNLGDAMPQILSGQLRCLAVLDKERNQYLPDVKTAEEQGYPAYFSSPLGVYAPKGTPKEIVDILSGAIKNVLETDEHKKKMAEQKRTIAYRDSAWFDNWWGEAESQVKLLMELGKTQ